MTVPAPHTRDTLGTIRRNAGRVPAPRLALALGWSLARLERVAAANGYDLKCRDGDELTSVVEFAAGEARDPAKRCVIVTIQLYPADAAALDALAHQCGIKRSRLVGLLVENARAHDLLGHLARLPPPTPRPEPAAP